MDKLEFLGEIKSLCIHGGMQGESLPSPISDDTADGGRLWVTAQIYDPRQLLLESIPLEHIDLKTLVASLKIEYLQIHYDFPGLPQIPSSKLEALGNKRDSIITQQAKTVNFKREYNPLTGYAVEIKLVKGFVFSASNRFPYGSDRSSEAFQYLLKLINYNNDYLREMYPFDSKYYNPHRKWEDERLSKGSQFFQTEFAENFDTAYRNHPINEYLYNGGLAGFLDLIPYIMPNGNLIFNNLNEAYYISTDICKLGTTPNPTYGSPVENQIIINGGFSGTAQYKEREKKIVHDQLKSINIPLTPTPVRILEETDKRALIYLTNNTDKKLFFSFGSSYFTTPLSPYLNPGDSFTWEHGEIISLGGGSLGYLKTYDKRAFFTLPLYVLGEALAKGTVNCDQYVFDY
ncbi:hypothetical protein PCC9214_05341 [Planktothrix tepida]|uniref:Uncharacterized protein n=1 Tax=Planktothrix tepida PCC 9214 TaxID=671072 RepID=A0A1J1LJR7_9CYAN|nr:hypothetical protein [Planktothrix tepida]CAD5984806.1 hypothetical protein PCC9214_05303 [Planktothrix tepida]CAD5985092.1 hypothetical protein PCC9214_05341 [Planktothrix tepida]CUR32148.1 hypothetical protein PL9214430120 [Planktothrix tepida PCC 9214]